MNPTPKRHKGEKAFRAVKPLLTLCVYLLRIVPRFLTEGLFGWIRGVPGYAGIALRYVFLKRLAGNAGDNIAIMPNVYFIGDFSDARFGSHISLWNNTWIDCDGLRMGNHVMLSHNASIISGTHLYDEEGVMMRDSVRHAPVTIGDNVWIGAGARIIGPVTIGNNVVIAANAVVNKDVESNTIVGGVPAKVLKKITVNCPAEQGA
ncbi:MAG: DapH/DapD/GlmU-related protein [Sulfuricurvum sp.]|nr:DapH/DapD/GlmU-related protein [Sulfuricurvum sp.]